MITVLEEKESQSQLMLLYHSDCRCDRRAKALMDLSEAYWREDNLTASAAALEKVVELQNQIDLCDSHTRARIAWNFALQFSFQGQHSKAELLLQQSLIVVRFPR